MLKCKKIHAFLIFLWGHKKFKGSFFGHTKSKSKILHTNGILNETVLVPG